MVSELALCELLSRMRVAFKASQSFPASRLTPSTAAVLCMLLSSCSTHTGGISCCLSKSYLIPKDTIPCPKNRQCNVVYWKSWIVKAVQQCFLNDLVVLAQDPHLLPSVLCICHRIWGPWHAAGVELRPGLPRCPVLGQLGIHICPPEASLGIPFLMGRLVSKYRHCAGPICGPLVIALP